MKKITQKIIFLMDFTRMKNIFFFIAFLSLLPYSVFSQQLRVSSFEQPSGDKLIKWEPPALFEVPGIGNKVFLKFDYAQYDIQNHFLPIYSEKIFVPKGTVDAEVKILNTSYEPLSKEEQAALNSYTHDQKNSIGSDIIPNTVIAYHKKKPVVQVEFVPIRKNQATGYFEKLVSFSLKVSPQISSASNSFRKPQELYSSNSVLSSGSWYKVAVLKDGTYKMDYNFLKNLGIDPDSISPQNIKVYGNGGGQLPYANSSFRYDDLQENSIFVFGENDGKFDSTDYVLFFGQSQHRWKYSSVDNQFHHSLNIYSDTTYYFITVDLGPGKRIMSQASSSLSPTTTVTTYNDFQFHEVETYNLIKSGRVWMGEEFDIITSYSYNISIPNIDFSSKVYIKVETGARANSPGTNFYWTAGSNSSSYNVTGVVTSNIYDTFYRTASDTMTFYPSSGIIPLTISKTTPSPSIGWLNYYEVNTRRQLTGEPMLLFRDINSVDTGNVSRFIISNAASHQVWEVTDPLNPKLQQTTLNGTALEFILPTDSLREFTAFQSAFIPIISGKVPNQNLHGSGPVDFIIVTHPLFLTQANTLADLHRNQDSMKVIVATTNQVFNEFSSGAQDVSAIRDFARMFYERAQDSTELPRYLLLFGDGSYNMKSTINNTNFIPCYQSLNSSSPTNSYVSDDFFAMLDSNEGYWDVSPSYMDIGVGRFPVKTINEAEVVVQKIVRYTSVPETINPGNSCSNEGTCYGFGDWMNVVTFCADDEDSGDHQKQADIMANKIKANHPNYNLDKIYFDAYQQVSTPGGERYPDANAAFARRMEKGSLIVNYTGHGGELGLAHERFLEIYHINSWTNQCRLPLFFTATCEFSRWEDPARTSAGELTFLHPEGGGIGLMTTTRVVYSGPNFTLNNYFYDYAFKPLSNGEMPRLGDLCMLTKNSMSPLPNSVNHRNFALLADPALSLHYPKYNVATTEINGTPVIPAAPDTLQALSKMTVKGEVRDKSGNLLTNFNGIIYPTVFDKAAKITTLSNDGAVSPPFIFYLQKNILFKGKASVTNGLFSFSFIVPKDISYNYAKARISYYGHNGYEDANGYCEDFVIGGTDSNAVADLTGPQIKLFMNDEKFVFGGTTDNNPKIFIVVTDSTENDPGSGINTAGTGIGHDITAILDNNTTNPFVLNDYYESDLNSYKKGTVRYPLSDLTEGSHNLSVKVWDVHNNSSTSYTEFVVASSAQFALAHVLNYPNPFTTKTSFYFEHNKPCENMDVQVQIFTVSGKLIKTIHESVHMEGFRSDAITWNGTDDYGDPIGRGVYVYRLRAKTSSGDTAEQIEKLVILK